MGKRNTWIVRGLYIDVYGSREILCSYRSTQRDYDGNILTVYREMVDIIIEKSRPEHSSIAKTISRLSNVVASFLRNFGGRTTGKRKGWTPKLGGADKRRILRNRSIQRTIKSRAGH